MMRYSRRLLNYLGLIACEMRAEGIRVRPRHLFFLAFTCDMESYKRTGRSISGTEWRKGRDCPLPVPERGGR